MLGLSSILLRIELSIKSGEVQGNLCLTTHRVEGHQETLQLKEPKEMGNRCNLVGLCIRSKLVPNTV